MKATVIGAGLAGCEAAWALAERGVSVLLLEMKPARFSPAHQNPDFAELVCSNSFKAMRPETAGGLLKAEMRAMGSLLLRCADECRVPAGGALAVDRREFSALVTKEISSHPNISTQRREVKEQLPEGHLIIASGPLTSDELAQTIAKLTQSRYLSFFDAVSPTVSFDSIDLSRAFYAARYERGGEDYINCPMDKQQYLAFYEQLAEAETAQQKDFENRAVFEGCLPVEVLAKRGEDALRFGPLRPVGLTDPKTKRRPWAALQLRAENIQKTLYNMVGFQTNLRFGEQERVFRMVPALENAHFVRFGVMHRNTFINAPRLLDGTGRLNSEKRIRFAGQLTGVEGYMESAVSGMAAGINTARELKGLPPLVWPPATMTGALLRHTVNLASGDYQPMGSNMGLLPPLERPERDKRRRYELMAQRALEELRQFSINSMEDWH